MNGTSIIWIKAKLSLKAEPNIHYKQILIPFDRVVLLLNNPRSIEEQKMILRQLGMIALSENINWLLTNDKQDLTLQR